MACPSCLCNSIFLVAVIHDGGDGMQPLVVTWRVPPGPGPPRPRSKEQAASSALRLWLRRRRRRRLRLQHARRRAAQIEPDGPFQQPASSPSSSSSPTTPAPGPRFWRAGWNPCGASGGAEGPASDQQKTPSPQSDCCTARGAQQPRRQAHGATVFANGRNWKQVIKDLKL